MTVSAAVEGAVRARDAAWTFARRHLVARPDDVALAVWEACVNVVTHAYHDPLTGVIDFSARRRHGDVLVTVGDRGGGLRPDLETPGLGIGLVVVASLADGCDITTDQHGTRLAMRFRCAGRPGGGPPWLAERRASVRRLDGRR